MARQVPSFMAKDLVRNISATPSMTKLPPMQGVPFGTLFTPHMLTIDYAEKTGWGKPTITDFAPMAMSPAAAGLQHGLQCFEGMKAYRNAEDGSVRMFRPEMNAKRLLRSHDRLTFPSFDTEEFVKVLSDLVQLDKEFIPTEKNYSLYIRPTSVATNADLSLDAPDAMRMFIIMSPVGPYYPTGFKPVKLLVKSQEHRAWPGGHGSYKLGPNYAGPVTHQLAAAKEGYGQILWTGPDQVVDEVGAMNFMLLWKNKNGERELLTPPLDGTILPGITRDSILTLARQWGEFKVTEARFTVQDVIDGLQEGRVEEIFGCGTAAIVTVLNALAFEGKEYAVPCPDSGVAMRFMENIIGIQTGTIPHDTWAHRVC